MHRMTFYWDTDVGIFMFPGLNINGVGPLAGVCAVLFLFALMYEAVKIIQTRSKSRAARETQHDSSACPGARLLHQAEEDETSRTQLHQQRQKQFCDRVGRTCLQTMVFLFQTILGYLLMLAVMAYNGYIFVLVIAGFALGYFFFGHIAMKINMENVRARKTHVLCSPSCPTQTPNSTQNCAHRSTNTNCPRQSRSQNTSGAAKNDGYTNELVISSSCSSLSNSLTQTTHLDKEIDMQPNDNDENNLIQSCRL